MGATAPTLPAGSPRPAQPVPAPRIEVDALTAIATRRSVGRLRAPAPSGADLEAILVAAAAAPDHCELRPWRFVVLEGEAKDALGVVLADSFARRCAQAGLTPTQGQLDKERHKLERAPLVLVVAAVHREHPTVGFTDQVASAAAATQNALLAATALGYASMWRTGDACTDGHVLAALGLSPPDKVVAFVYLGTPHEGWAPEPRQVSLEGVVQWGS